MAKTSQQSRKLRTCVTIQGGGPSGPYHKDGNPRARADCEPFYIICWQVSEHLLQDYIPNGINTKKERTP